MKFFSAVAVALASMSATAMGSCKQRPTLEQNYTVLTSHVLLKHILTKDLTRRRLYVKFFPLDTLQLTHSKVLLVVDLQDGLYNAVRDFDPVTFKESIIAHAAIGKLFDLPVILTTSAEQGMVTVIVLEMPL